MPNSKACAPSPEREARLRLLQLEREKAKRAARKHLMPFTLWTFPGYQVSWHHRVIAERLTQLVMGIITRLILTVGPRRGKSELASRRLPAFALGVNPDWEVVGASYAQDLSTEMSRDTKRVILDGKYRELFPDTTLNPRHVVSDDRHASVNTADRWDIIGHKGKYTGRGVGGGLTGRGFNLGIVDDPFKDDEEARSETRRDAVWRWYQKVFWTRRAPNARIVVMHTRWHEDDLVGRLLNEANTHKTADQWTVVNLREIREDDENPDDPRQTGEVLWPERYPLSEAEALAERDPATFAALYQQRPAPAGGYECKADWMRNTYRILPVSPGLWVISWDLRNGGKTPRSSLACGQVWFMPDDSPGKFFLVHEVTGRWDYPEEEARFVNLCRMFPQALVKLVENKADGRTLIPRLQSKIAGIIAVDVPGGSSAESKLTRFRSVLPAYKAGNVWIPDPEVCPWVVQHIHELTTFPASATNDRVDTASQALTYLLEQAQKSLTSAWWAA